MRLDSYFTKEEFIKSIDERITDDDIRMMFEYANIKKDEQAFSDNHFLINNPSLLLNEDIFKENFSTILNMENVIKTSEDTPTEFKCIIKPYTNNGAQQLNTLLYYLIRKYKVNSFRSKPKVKIYKYEMPNIRNTFDNSSGMLFGLDNTFDLNKHKEEIVA